MSDRISVSELKEKLRYDPETGVLVWAVKVANHIPAGREIVHVDREGYMRLYIRNNKLFAHRVAWAIHHNSWPEGVIDHKNGVRTDNRLCNLRNATLQDNRHNRIDRPIGASGYIGVNCCKGGQRWSTQIRLAKVTHYLGRFDDPISAAIAYDRALTYFHGEFASTNFRLGLI